VIAPEHQTTDGFWDIRAQEKETQDHYQKQIDQLERVINLGKRSLQLRGQPGYQDFVKSLEDLSRAEEAKLIACFSGNEHMRVIQGKAQAFHDILALLRDTEKSVEGLELRLEAVKNEMAVVVRGDGKVVPDSLGAKK
jgi:hypothetical protein